jgi:hypothetical protein
MITAKEEQIVLTIDVAHPPRKPDLVEEELEEALSKVSRTSSLRIVKIIHGKNGTTKENVRNWAYKQRRRLQGIIYGEDYDLFEKTTQNMRLDCGAFPDKDIGSGNNGIIILWIK